MTIPTLQWTPPASAGLERYFAARLAPDQLDGADPAELRGDLQAHLEEELTQRGVTAVTVEDLRQALAKMGEVLPPAAPSIPPTARPILIPTPAVSLPPEAMRHLMSAPKEKASFGGSGWFLFFAVFMPLGTFLFEVLTRGGAGMFFDPMPDFTHHVLVLLVPLAGLACWRAKKPDPPARLMQLLPWLLGAGLACAGFYTLCFLPVMPMALIGIVWFGLGLLPLTPFVALLALWRCRTLLLRSEGNEVKTPLRWGFRLTFLFILLWELPGFLTYQGIHRASEAGADAPAWASATGFIRTFGSENTLLKSCYPGRGGSMMAISSGKDPAAWLAGWFNISSGNRPSPWNESQTVSRELYYRVTGVPFNEIARPEGFRPLLFNHFNRQGNWSSDTDRGGTKVAGRIDGLTLAEGRMDWHCEEASGLTWGEWTLTFDNVTGTAEEARCRIALPPGGFVSRVTLWVNGQPEEAAFSTVAKVRAAYQSVAVMQRRDPVLVTQPDAGSILVQAFPVPARGQLKTRITFTVPAGTDSRVWLPSIVERNFELPVTARHPLWVQADRGILTMPDGVAPQAAVEGGAPTVTGTLPHALFTGRGTFFTWAHQPAEIVYADDSFAAPEHRHVVRKRDAPAGFQPKAIAWVIDTSSPLASYSAVISDAVSGLSSSDRTAIFLPGDAPSEMRTLTDPGNLNLTFAGGRDNGPALTAAVDWLRGKPGSCLIWIHGPQPGAAGSRSALEQLLERSVAPFTLVDVPLVPGENTLGPAFAGLSRITALPVRHAGSDLAASLRAAFQQRGGTFTTQTEGTDPPDGAIKTSDSLARWFARIEASRLALTNPAAASAMAASHQIVSPWSGAVVLERATDYAQHGLTQSNAAVSQQIPVIPEPSSVLLLLFSVSHFLLRRRR